VEIGAVYNGFCKPQSGQKPKDNYSADYIEMYNVVFAVIPETIV